MNITGTLGNDNGIDAPALTGTDGNDVIDGRHGDDLMDGRGGDDVLWGGRREDSYFADDGLDTLIGGDGNDTLWAYGADTLYGGDGNDLLGFAHDPYSTHEVVLDGGAGRDTLDGDTNYWNPPDFWRSTLTGIEVLRAGGSLLVAQVGGFEVFEDIWKIFVQDSGVVDLSGKTVTAAVSTSGRRILIWEAATGDDVLNLSSMTDSANLYMSDGHDRTIAGVGHDTLVGATGNDTLYGGDGLDEIYGDGTLFLPGDDELELYPDNDVLYGGESAADLSDLIEGGRGSDLVFGGYGNDILRGGGLGERATDRDTIYGGEGSDTITGSPGADSLFGGDSETDVIDLINGRDGNDLIDGGYGNDSLLGGLGDDTVIGGFGTDTIIGNDGNDLLSGGQGSDLMMGGPGNDYFNGGFGYDRLNGGAGADRFFHAVTAGHGTDWIQDFSAGDALVVPDGELASNFQVNFARTPSAGSAAVDEAFVIYRPTGQIIFALVDGGALSSIALRIDEVSYDLLA